MTSAILAHVEAIHAAGIAGMLAAVGLGIYGGVIYRGPHRR